MSDARGRLTALGLAALCALAACKTIRAYPGPARPGDEVALVRCERRADVLPFGQLVLVPVTWIEAVDGEPVTVQGPRMELLAGRRRLLIGYRYFRGTAKSVLREVELEPGASYSLELEGRGDEATPVLVRE